MSIVFIACCTGMICILPFYAISLHHDKFLEKFGEAKGKIISNALSIASGWLFFAFWIGIWLSPQERFPTPVTIFHFLLSMPIFFLAIILGIGGVSKVSLRVAETHRPVEVVDTGVYSLVRNPQYLAGLLAHVSLSIMLSAFYSLLITPLIFLIIVFMCMQEEELMIREFGQEYIAYMQKTPMLIPFTKKFK